MISGQVRRALDTGGVGRSRDVRLVLAILIYCEATRRGMPSRPLPNHPGGGDAGDPAIQTKAMRNSHPPGEYPLSSLEERTAAF